ncbi:MAG: glucose-1-phosphate adenylyltransferase [Chloroflexota bacterium]
MENVLVMIMAGGVGQRLRPLTSERAKSSVPFGGKYQLIDFTLSNCVNSGMRQIFVLTQYRASTLHNHIQEGWHISSSGLGDFIYCVPAQQKLGADWYQGTADAVRQNLDLLKDRKVEHVLILSGDHVYKMNYLQMANYHEAKNAGLTIASVRVKKEEAANRLGVLVADPDHGITGFEEKPAEPKIIPDSPDETLVSMGIYLFEVDALREALQGTESDFGKEVIPRMLSKGHNLFVYDYQKENKIEDYIFNVTDGKRKKTLVARTRDSSYWKDVGTLDSYHEASMNLVGVDPLFNLYGEKWPIRTYQQTLPPSKCILGGRTPESMMCDGCIVSGGTVWRSIISPGVVVERNAHVEESVIFDDVAIEPHTRVRRAIVDKNARIDAYASVGYDREKDIRRGCIISDGGIVVVPRGKEIKPD